MHRNRKLAMKRETIRSLDALAGVAGGGTGTIDDTIGGSRRPISCVGSHCYSCGRTCQDSELFC